MTGKILSDRQKPTARVYALQNNSKGAKQSLFTPNPFEALANPQNQQGKMKNSASKKQFLQKEMAKQSISPKTEIISKQTATPQLQNLEKNLTTKQRLLVGSSKVILCGTALMTHLTPAAASSSNNDFLNPDPNFNTAYTIEGETFSVKRMLARISENCGSQADFRIFSPAVHYVKYTIWASVRSRDSEGDRQGSFDDCVSKQVQFVAHQNNVIVGTIVGLGLGGALLVGGCWYYRSQLASFMAKCCPCLSSWNNTPAPMAQPSNSNVQTEIDMQQQEGNIV